VFLVFEKVRAEFVLPETEVAEQAYRFAEQIEPAFVFAHSVRSYLYARELAGRGSFRDYDDELLFLSCVLHDIGLTDQGNREQRFEVDGADLASEFLRERSVDERRARIVWLAVALHTSDGIASRMGPEIALAQVGILADILGLGREELPADLVNSAHAAFPRNDLGFALAEAIVAQATAKPNKATPASLPGQLVRWHQPIGTLPDWYDLVSAAGWGDRPAAARQEGTATTPDQLGPLFTRYLAAGDLEALVSLYEPAATLRPEPGRVASGTDAIRESLQAYVEAGARISLELRTIRTTGDLALLSNRATAEGLLPGGAVLSTTTTEVARRQPDGRWLYVIDDPFFGD
jgi:uncharacterized protein (TIGR02246 family)